MISSSMKHGCISCDFWSSSSQPAATGRMCLRPEHRVGRPCGSALPSVPLNCPALGPGLSSPELPVQ